MSFIPWDDDIDMVMMRDDYDRFVEVINDELEEPYFFESIKLPIPTCYDEFLTSQFGDYMTPQKLAPIYGGLYLGSDRNYDVVRKEFL